MDPNNDSVKLIIPVVVPATNNSKWTKRKILYIISASVYLCSIVIIILSTGVIHGEENILTILSAVLTILSPVPITIIYLLKKHMGYVSSKGVKVFVIGCQFVVYGVQLVLAVKGFMVITHKITSVILYLTGFTNIMGMGVMILFNVWYK
jgi:hypothetical protein